jgi:hypothetical protein
MTQYSDAGVEALLRERPEVLEQLQRVTEQAVQQSAFAANERAREYLRSGVGRRLRVLHRALSNMFELFPVSTVQPIDRDDLFEPAVHHVRRSEVAESIVVVRAYCGLTCSAYSCNASANEARTFSSIAHLLARLVLAS